jgi:hypothetical protein
VVHAELLEGPVRADQERQHVEPLRAVVPDEVGMRTRRHPDRFRDRRILPGFVIDQNFAVRRQAPPEPEQAGMSPRGDDPAAGSGNQQHSIADDPAVGDLRSLDPLAGHGLHRVSPQLLDPHGNPPLVLTSLRRKRG